jgi:hypothetical protein
MPMKKLKTEFKSVSKNLKALSRKTEKMIKRLDKLEKTQMVKKTKSKPKPKAKAVKKAPVRELAASKKGKMSAADTVFGLIKRSRKGVDADTLRKKTGLEGRKIWDITYRLKKQGKINKDSKGLFSKA